MKGMRHIYLIILALIMTGCISSPTEPVYDNPNDERGINYLAPAILAVTSDPSDGSSRDMTITWRGSSVVKYYEYTLDNGSTVQTTQTSATFYDLDEGTHRLIITPYTDYRNGGSTTLTFSINAIVSPGIVFSPRRITSSSPIKLIFEDFESLMGGHIEIVCNDDCADISTFALHGDSENVYEFITFNNAEDSSRLIIDFGCLKEDGFSGSITVGEFMVNPTLNGEVHIDSDKTFLRNLDNDDITIIDYDFVRIVK